MRAPKQTNKTTKGKASTQRNKETNKQTTKQKQKPTKNDSYHYRKLQTDVE